MNKKEKVLVVDDDPELLKIISRWLILKSWDVTTASDGVEGLRLFSEKKDYSFVLTDLNMPNMDGLKMAEKIKK